MRGYIGHFRQEGLLVGVSDLLENTVNPKKGIQGVWRVRISKSKEGNGN